MDYILLSMALMGIGIYGLLAKRQLLKTLISIELLATAASMNFVLLAPILDKTLGQTFLMLAVSTDTCLTAIVIGLFIVMSKKYHTRDIRKLANLDFSETSADNKETD